VTTIKANIRTRIIPTIIFDLVYGVLYTKVRITKIKMTTHPTYNTYLLIIFGKNWTSKKYTNANRIEIHADIFIASEEL
jgi:hypothetical protein